jgi:hypothetical protein
VVPFLPKSFVIVCSPRTTKFIEFMIRYVLTERIIFVGKIFLYSDKTSCDIIDHNYSFITINYAIYPMGINKKGAVIAIGIIAFMIAIGGGM